MSSLAVLVGGLTADAEQKETKDGKPYLLFSIGMKDPFDRTKSLYFNNIRLYGEKRVAALRPLLRKGTAVTVACSIRPWKSGSGDATKYGTDYIVNELDIQKFVDGAKAGASPDDSFDGAPSDVPDSVPEDDIPF